MAASASANKTVGGVSLLVARWHESALFTHFFFNDTATTEIYSLSLHDALPICPGFCSAAGRTVGNGLVRTGEHCGGDNQWGAVHGRGAPGWQGGAGVRI